jgi:cellulose synthase/poly-beta-1,6-N-acetylglucosamine synthase-like glycosyltransferase
VDRPFVSIVVPVLNGGAAFGDLLKSLQHLSYPKECHEIIVVDNGSDDDSAARALAAGPPVRLVTEPRRGASLARNAGVAAARGDIVAFTDADCVVTRGWLEALTQPFADPSIGGVGGRTETYLPGTWTERHAARTRHLDAEFHLRHPTFPFAPTANAAFRRSLFDTIGGFDPEFPWGEPIDFCKRVVRDGGARLAFAPRAIVFHRARATLGGFYRQQQGYGYSLALLCDKYRDEVTWDWKRDFSADWDVMRAGLLVPWSLVEASALRRGAEAIESRTLEFVRQFGRRSGFRRARRERALRLN